MAKTNQIDLLRKLIREEVAKAIRQEMPAILQEIQTSSTTKQVIKESKQVKKAIPGTLNTQPVRPTPNFSGNPATLGKPGSEESLNKFSEINEELNTLVDQRFALDKSVRDARYALNIAKTDLPAGDPAIAIAEQTLTQTKQQLKTLDDRLVEIRNRQAQLASAPGSSVNSTTTGAT